MHGHQVKHPWRLLTRRARTPRAKDGAAMLDNFSLDEQLAECRMDGVSRWWCENNLTIAGDVDYSARVRAIGNAHPAQFDVILGRDDYLSVRNQIVVAATKLDSSV